MFRDCPLFGCYRDDELAIFEKKLTEEEIITWRDDFQEACNELLGSDKLQFPKTIWEASSESKQLTEKIDICGEETFSFLDLEFLWDDTNHLIYQVHLKENQKLKYLNHESNHLKACFKAIATGV